MKLSVIIVSYNVKYYLEQCLRSLFKSVSNEISMEVYVVDNASSDGSVEHLQHHFPQTDYPELHIIANSRNVGFGRANNQAVKKAKGEYILFLNPDTLLTEHTLADSLRFADEKKDLGGMGVMMLRDGGAFAYESRRGLPTPWTSFCKMTGLNVLFPHSRIFGKYYLRYLDKEKSSEIEIISGAYFLVRTSALQQTGGFDEEFFMYGEDIDLSYRLLLNGYHNYYTPTPILHYKGESTHKSTFRYVHVFYNAMLIFFKKHFRFYWIGLSLPIKLAILLRALLALLGWQLASLRKFLLPVRKVSEYRFLYIGRHEAEVMELAEKWQLDVDVLSADEATALGSFLQQEQTKGKYHYVVFDTDDFSYDYILNTFRNSDHKAYIGTFYPLRRLLITGSKVFDMDR